MKTIDPEQYVKTSWVVVPERRVSKRLQNLEAPFSVWLGVVAGLLFFMVKDDVYEWIGLFDVLHAANRAIDRSIGTWAGLAFGVPIGITIHGFLPIFLAVAPLWLWLRELEKREREHRCARCGHPAHIEEYPPRDACADTICTECGLRLLIVPATSKKK
jgi:DNA-directed RNA polymerase subunit RPC12/RpoP